MIPVPRTPTLGSIPVPRVPTLRGLGEARATPAQQAALYFGLGVATMGTLWFLYRLAFPAPVRARRRR